jgi:hypothetical protein
LSRQNIRNLSGSYITSSSWIRFVLLFSFPCGLTCLFQVKQIKHGKEVKIDLMVMENLLFGHNISRIYDLKGAIFSRRVTDSNDHDTVYLDQNYVEDMGFSPIYIGGRTKHLLQRAIWNDTSFLTVSIKHILATITGSQVFQ